MAELADLLLQDYYPGKYALHTRLEDLLPGFPEGRGPSEWYFTPEEWQSEGYDDTIAGLYLRNPGQVRYNLDYILPKLAFRYALDKINVPGLSELIKHEGFHAYVGQGLDKPTGGALRYEMGQHFPMGSEPAKELSQFYPPSPHLETPEEYFKRLAGEYGARVLSGEMEPFSPYWERFQDKYSKLLLGE